MDFTVVVYTKEGTNRFLEVLARSNMVASAKHTEGADMTGGLQCARGCLEDP